MNQISGDRRWVQEILRCQQAILPGAYASGIGLGTTPLHAQDNLNCGYDEA